MSWFDQNRPLDPVVSSDPTYTTGMGIDERTGQPRAPVGGPDPRLQIPSGEPGSPGNTGQVGGSPANNGQPFPTPQGHYEGGRWVGDPWGGPAGGGFTGNTGAAPPTGAGGAAPTLNRNDPASVQAFISYYAQQPGANPSLARDPGYWAGKISSGELGSDQNYIIGKFMTPEGAPAGSYNNGLNGPVGATPFTFQYDPNSPDAQFIRGEAMRAATQGFAARGTLNTGGAVKALQDRAAGLASVDLGNQFQRQLTTHQTNFNEPLQANNQAFGQNFNLANLGLNATTAGINGANAVASNATSYANTAQNNTNAQGGYQTNIGNAQGNAILGGQNAYNNLYGDLGNLSRQYPNY